MSWKGKMLAAGISSDGVDVDVFGGSIYAGNIASPQGKDIYLDPTNGSDTRTGRSPAQANLTFAVAYAKLTAGQNDRLIYLAGTSSLSLPATITWAKSYTHFIGLAAPTFMAQRSRVFHSADFSPMITVSGTGCLFKNLYFSYGRGGADNHVLMNITGGRCVFDNIHFAMANHATEAADAASRGVVINGTSGEHLFRHCTFGNDTVARSAASASVEFAGSTPRNMFEDCLFEINAGAVTPVHVLAGGASALDRFAIFKDCLFHAHGTSTLTQAINSDLTGVNRRIILMGSTFSVGATDIADAAGDGTIYFRPETATANVALLGANVAVS